MSEDKYVHNEVEDKIYTYWEKNNLFKPKKNKKKFCYEAYLRSPSLRRRWLGDETPSSNHPWIGRSVLLLACDSGLIESCIISQRVR